MSFSKGSNSCASRDSVNITSLRYDTESNSNYKSVLWWSLCFSICLPMQHHHEKHTEVIILIVMMRDNEYVKDIKQKRIYKFRILFGRKTSGEKLAAKIINYHLTRTFKLTNIYSSSGSSRYKRIRSIYSRNIEKRHRVVLITLISISGS